MDNEKEYAVFCELQKRFSDCPFVNGQTVVVMSLPTGNSKAGYMTRVGIIEEASPSGMWYPSGALRDYRMVEVEKSTWYSMTLRAAKQLLKDTTEGKTNG